MRRATLALVATCALLPGCYYAHVARYGAFGPAMPSKRLDKPFTPFFGGTAMGTVVLVECLASPVIGWWWDERPPWAIVAAPLVALDIPLSFVADVLFIPGDIGHFWARRSKRTEPVGAAEPARPPP